MAKKSKWHSIPWHTRQYLEEMMQCKDKKMRIIALFAQLKDYHFDNYQQIQFFIARNQGTAKRLQCFPLNKIEKVLRYLIDSADYKVSLETIEKFILEDVGSLKGEEPIIVYKNEKVYDIKRLAQLEKEGKIKYSKDKWHEIM